MSFRTAPGPIGADLQKTPYCGKLFIYKTLDQIEAEAEEMGYDSKAIKLLKNLKTDVTDSTAAKPAR